MSTKSYSNLDLIIVTESSSTLGDGVITGTSFNKVGSSSANFPVEPFSNAGYGGYAYINFTLPLGIPELALISAIRCSVLGNGLVTSSITGAGATATINLGIIEFLTPGVGSQYSHDGQDAFDADAAVAVDGIGASFNRSIGWEILYDPPISRDELIAICGDIGDYDNSGSYLVIGIISSASATVGASGSSVESDAFSFEVDYTLQYNFTLDTAGPVEIGDVIQISSIDGGLDGVKEVQITWNDGEDHVVVISNFNTQTPNLLQFNLIGYFNSFSGDLSIVLIGSGRTFSGSVALGILPILFVNGSGLYTLVKDKRTDTVYDRDVPGETFELKIFNPFGKTGYIGG